MIAGYVPGLTGHLHIAWENGSGVVDTICGARRAGELLTAAVLDDDAFERCPVCFADDDEDWRQPHPFDGSPDLAPREVVVARHPATQTITATWDGAVLGRLYAVRLRLTARTLESTRAEVEWLFGGGWSWFSADGGATWKGVMVSSSESPSIGSVSER